MDLGWYPNHPVGVSIDLSRGTAIGGDTDRLFSVEDIQATQFDDELIGDDGQRSRRWRRRRRNTGVMVATTVCFPPFGTNKVDGGDGFDSYVSSPMSHCESRGNAGPSSPTG